MVKLILLSISIVLFCFCVLNVFGEIDINPGSSIELDSIDELFSQDNSADFDTAGVPTYNFRWIPQQINAAKSRYIQKYKLSGVVADDFNRIIPAYLGLIQELLTKPELFRVNKAHYTIHRAIIYRTDMQIYGVEDYWAAPLETLYRRVGDCEDIAILKYFVLLASGVPYEKLKLEYVKTSQGQGHMVLGYYEPANTKDPLIIDNLRLDPYQKSQATTMGIKEFIFSIDLDSMYYSGIKLKSTATLTKWMEVIQKAKTDSMITVINNNEAELDEAINNNAPQHKFRHHNKDKKRTYFS
jgi:hypothetical protein